MANLRAPDAGGRASGDHLVAYGAPDFSPVKEPTALFVEGLINRRWSALGGSLLHIVITRGIL